MAKENSPVAHCFHSSNIVISVDYLICYNAACMAGWLHIWYLLYHYSVSETALFWDSIGTALKLVQTAAVMEIVHSMMGIVRSPVMTTALQVFSRLILTWGYANPCPDVQNSFGLKLMVLSWSLVEVPRYLFYIVKLLNLSMPSWLLFLRYNLFLVLYPTGITGEILTIYRSLPFIKSTQLFSFSLPNAWNFAFNYYAVSVFYLLLYIPRSIWCMSYMHSRSLHDHEHAEPEAEECDVLNT